ncbi:hypothetical protein CVT25_002898 [Psilocybe cyanescens]|uniref:Uncharacterized protein n=1 Tax=Psilocybe cyanescens TaxID=93625 RepID=A0A409WKQ0_PSICY|nr:hypothetical protein CVT25_002898 [Psilocybe cyanescens]
MVPLEMIPASESPEEPALDAKAPVLDGDGKDEPTVEPNVIDTVFSESVNSDKLKSDDPDELDSPATSPPPSEPPSPLETSRSSPRRILTMPGLADLSDIILHSPSQIVGTPYAINSTRFEYPFPDTVSTHSSGSPPTSSPMNSVLSPPVASGSSFPVISTSASSSQISSPTFFYPISSSNISSYNSAHPKLRTQTNPPIPPSLARKRTRWSLNLIGRRKSSSAGSQSSATSATSDGSSVPTIDGLLSGQQVNTALEYQREDRGKQ